MLMKSIIYHNPRCSKSRETLALLQNRGIDLVVVEYLKNPLDIEQLKALRAHFSFNDFVRTDEPIFKTLGLSMQDEIQILHAMVKDPVLMQRPIVTFNGQARIGRPPEKVLELFD